MTPALLREARLDDLEAVGALFRQAHWSTPTAEGWRHLWRANPAAARMPDAGFGWVVESGGKPVGFLRNVFRQYRYRGRDLMAAAASTLVVHPDFRGHSLRLMTAFCKQPGVDLLLNTTAAPETAKVFDFLKFRRIPQADYDVSLYWVLEARGFLAAGLRRKGVPAGVSRLAGLLLAAPVRSALTLTGRRITGRSRRARIEVINSSGIDRRFDDLWERKSREAPCLLACRDRATLSWHFASLNRPHPPSLVCAFEGDRLLGYVAILRQDSEHLGLRRMRVADVFVEGNDEEIIRALMSEAARHAASDGAALLEVVGMPQGIRRTLGGFRPFHLRDRSWPFWYRTDDAELRTALQDRQHWHATLYDGDGSL